VVRVMVRRGRIPQKERAQAISRIISALKEDAKGLGLRELRKRSGIGSFETLYKYLHELEDRKEVTFSERNVGRGKPKKIYKLSKTGIAYLLEFKVMEHLERIRELCKKKEQFELDNYTFSYIVYGIPKELTAEERKQVTSILRRINSNLIDLDVIRYYIVNREAHRYRDQVSAVYGKIIKHVSGRNEDKRPVIIDRELGREIMSYVPPAVKEKMRLSERDEFAIVATRGPSFIDEFSLRPENHLMWLLESVESWDDDGLNFVIEQLARNEHVDQEAIDRIKKWDAPTRKISSYHWQKLINKLDDLPKIREAEMQRKKEMLTRSSDFFKRVLGIAEEGSIVVTKDLLGKEKLNEIKRELSKLM